MQPTKLKKQVRAGQPTTDLQFAPAGKTLVGGTQWSIRLRPGLAAPVIVSKHEQAKAEAVAPTSAGLKKRIKAVEAAAATKNATVAGYGFWNR